MVVVSYGRNKNTDNEIKKNREKAKNIPSYRCAAIKKRKELKIKPITKEKKRMRKAKGRRKEQKRKRQTKEKKDRKEIHKGKREKRE